jgi:uncharacterized membrane protein
MTPTEQLTTIVATVLTGLVAGTYFAYATSVMLALRRLDDRTFIEVMQKINITIQNPAFFTAFFGAPTFAAVTVGLQASNGNASGWTIAALALNIAALLITTAANVPLNNTLDAAGEPATIAEPGKVRNRFERAWNAWNATRGVALVAAVVCLGMALRGR